MVLVIQRKSDLKFYKNGPKIFRRKKSYEEGCWTADINKARIYSGKSGTKSSLPYKADEKDYQYVILKIEQIRIEEF